MANRIQRDRLREFVDLISASLDEHADGAHIAARAFLSRYHFDRLVSAALGESPAAFRRRLLIERAAWRIRDCETSVTEAANEAGYDSVEGFSRSFSRYFRNPPSRFKQSGASIRAPSPNGVHFHPPAGLLVPAPTKGRTPMDLTRRLIEHDLWLTRRLLARATELPPEALDQAVWPDWDPLAFDAEEATLRSMLARLVWTKENWTAAIAGRSAPADVDTSIEGLGRRLYAAGTEFAELVVGIADRGEWDTGFVDALCDPPESFSFGGMVAHVLTFSAYRRQMLLHALHRLGVDDVGIGDPVEWERSLS